MTPLDFACPVCDVGAHVPCRFGPGGQHRGTHSARIVRARKETEGPQHLDVVYRDGLKYRVLMVVDDEVQLRRGNSHTIHRTSRTALFDEPIAGMWRGKAEVAS